jgi:PDZ domain-containing protein/aspartyl protease
MNASSSGRDRRTTGGVGLSRASMRASVWATALIMSLGLSLARTGTGRAFEPQAAATAPARAQAPAPPAAKAEKSKTKAVVPFEMLPTNHMLVQARINDKGPYRLIFDLGAPVTLLGNRVSEAAGVVKANAPRSFLFGMRGEAEVDKLQVGELTVAKLPVIVLDHPVLKALEDATGRRIDGLMGFTFFARYKTTIDYHAHQMTFEPIDYQIRDLLKELPERLMGPKVARHRVLAPASIWGLRLGEPTGGLDSRGVPIVKIHDGSPAALAGFKPGDVLITVDGRWATSIADVYRAAADVEPGRKVDVVIHRDGKEMTLAVTLADGA